MINTKKFKGKMVEKGHTYKSLATKMKITGYTLGQKVSNKKKMTLEEANICAEELGVSDLEFKDIFLQN
ncbi:MAG: XRE family transcriptional regulator [Clostridia bacterium]|nr:XRE family transcriptional regulator [Clostridia bacterium]